MNREIKFRAWDKKSHVLRDVIDLKFKSGNYYTMLSNPTISAPDNWTLRNKDEVILMQYTGLKDKNNKEIYEGDICKFYNKYSDMWYTRVVRYCPMFAAFALYPDMEEKWNYESDWLKISDVEAIGNIYENPELIGK